MNPMFGVALTSLVAAPEDVAEVLGAPVQRTEPREVPGPSGQDADPTYASRAPTSPSGARRS